MPSSSRSSPRSERSGDHGQATVETALVLPVVALALLVVLQIGLVVRSQVLVTHAAREGARAGVVEPRRAAIRRAAISATDLPAGQVQVTVTGDLRPGAAVTVEVSHRVPATVPLLAAAVDDVTVRSEVSMVVE